MPTPPFQKGLEVDSLPLPPTWAETYKLRDYWERKELFGEFPACEADDEMGQDGFMPGYDITDDW